MGPVLEISTQEFPGPFWRRQLVRQSYEITLRTKVRKRDGVRLHLYARQGKTPGFDAIIRRIQDDGNMGEIRGWTTNLREVYQAADVMLTGNTIDTRSVRESMACGCPIVRVGTDLNIEQDFDSAIASDRNEIRKQAEQRFDMKETASQFKNILEAI